MWKSDITRGLWRAVTADLICDGLTHAVTGTAWGRLKGTGLASTGESWPVVTAVCREAAVGRYLDYRPLNRRSG